MVSLRAEEAKRAAIMFAKKREPELADNDDMFFDAKEYHTSNKEVANILSMTTGNTDSVNRPAAGAALLAEDNAWGDEDEIDIDGDDDEGMGGN